MYFCYVNEEKLNEAEWNEAHKHDVEHGFEYYGEYWHCNSYADYSKEFDDCMAAQIRNRDNLRKWYVRLMKAPFSDEWADEISSFNECYKDCYGVSPHFFDAMLAAKGATRQDVYDAWDRERERWENQVKAGK